MNAAEAGITEGDAEAVAAQLGRAPRGLQRVAHRCPCGLPDVVETAPRLPDGTPFPTLYYLTCPRAAAAISGLEAAGRMREMTERLADEQLRPATGGPTRTTWPVGRPRRRSRASSRCRAGTQSAGGMPERVKCLHALVAHELAVPGTNPFGREALDEIGPWWSARPLRGTARGGGVTTPGSRRSTAGRIRSGC